MEGSLGFMIVISLRGPSESRAGAFPVGFREGLGGYLGSRLRVWAFRVFRLQG